MNRRKFIGSLSALFVAASASLVSVCTKKSNAGNKKPDLYGDCYIGGESFTDLYVSPETMEEIRSWNVDQLDEVSRREIYAETDLNENRYYNPRWNINGSWSKAESRTSLISHLSGSNHGHKRSYLNTLSTDELQKLHDKDHESKSSKTTGRRRWFRR